jgi:DivIVA domain-containing protein
VTWFFGVLLVLLIGGIAVVAAGQGESLAPAETDEPRPRLPEHRLRGADLRTVRFTTAFRGYRADEVDALLARLAQELDDRDDLDHLDDREGQGPRDAREAREAREAGEGPAGDRPAPEHDHDHDHERT